MGDDHERASGPIICFRGLDALIVDGYLFFESVQLRIVINLPPFAAQLGVAGLGEFPTGLAVFIGGCSL